MTKLDAGVFPPTLREVMLRPRWIAMLVLCLAVAAVFAWLGQWQLARAVDASPREAGATEYVLPIADVIAPGANIPEPLVGQRVDVAGAWVSGDFVVVSSRFNEGVEGFWVTGQLRLVDGLSGTPDQATSLAVAIGWAATFAEARAVAARLDDSAAGVGEAEIALTGRLVSDEGPVLPPKDDAAAMTRMSPAALINVWHDTDELDVYRPYLVAEDAVDGLTVISAAAPDEATTVNWLNIFYAAEWAIFAGFAFYLWYRLAKDAWERELEELSGESEDDLAPEAPVRRG